MTINHIVDQFSLTSLGDEPSQDREISDVYVSDLLSDVMANCKEGSIWITLQTHINIVAVAAMKDVPAIIIVNGRRPDGETIAKANEEGVLLLGTTDHTFEIAGKLYTMLHS